MPARSPNKHHPELKENSSQILDKYTMTVIFVYRQLKSNFDKWALEIFVCVARNFRIPFIFLNFYPYPFCTFLNLN